jgi:hypothetical protein
MWRGHAAVVGPSGRVCGRTRELLATHPLLNDCARLAAQRVRECVSHHTDICDISGSACLCNCPDVAMVLRKGGEGGEGAFGMPCWAESPLPHATFPRRSPVPRTYPAPCVAPFFLPFSLAAATPTGALVHSGSRQPRRGRYVPWQCRFPRCLPPDPPPPPPLRSPSRRALLTG